MSITVTGPNGIRIEFADGTDPATIERVMASAAGQQPSAPSMSLAERGEDLAKSGGSGLVQGVVNLAGLPGAFREGMASAAGWAAGKFGVDPEAFRERVSRSAKGPFEMFNTPTPEQVGERVAEAYGDYRYKPKTVAGEYVKTVGEFAPGAAFPGSLAMRAVGGVAAPAVASETMGQLFKGKPEEPWMRAAGGFAGGLAGTGAVAAMNARRSHIPGVSNAAGRTLETKTGAGAEQRLSELGPDAFLFEGSPQSFGVAQGLASRPSEAMDVMAGAVRGRDAAANIRLTDDLNRALGPAEVPTIVESALAQQRQNVAKDYNAATRMAQRLNPEPIVKRINRDIDVEAGAPRKTLSEIKGYLYKQQRFQDANGEWQTKNVLKTSAEELLNVRQAIDDLISRTSEPNALRMAATYRTEIDKLMPREVKAVDARFSELAKQSEALVRGGQVLNTGKEAIRPVELMQEMATMTPGQKSLLRVGARAELDRLVGTKANDVTALKLLVQSEGDWNRAKFAAIFGQNEADKIMRATNREVAFKNASRRLLENSQTAQRLAGQKEVAVNSERAPMVGATATGMALEGVRKGYDWITNALRTSNRNATDAELARLYTSQGVDRDDLLRAIREGQRQRRAGRPSHRDARIRAVFGAEAGSLH